MNYRTLTNDELVRFATTDDNARQYLVENFRHLVDDAVMEGEAIGNEALLNAYQDGENNGSNQELQHLRETYLEDIRTWLDRMPEMRSLNGNDVSELEDLLAALHAELDNKT